MDIAIRRGVPADAAALAEIAARTFRDTFAADNRAEDMDLHEAEAYGPIQQGRELADQSMTTLLVQAGDTLAGGELAGFAQLRRQPAPACVSGEAPIELWRFYILNEWHGRGIAQELMRRVVSEAGDAGARTLWLGVWERNERAQAFYRKVGFADVGTTVFIVGADVQTERVMVRALTGRLTEA